MTNATRIMKSKGLLFLSVAFLLVLSLPRRMYLVKPLAQVGDSRSHQNNLVFGRLQAPMRLRGVASHGSVQKIDVALHATGPLVQARGLGAILDARNVLRGHTYAPGKCDGRKQPYRAHALCLHVINLIAADGRRWRRAGIT